MIRPVLLAELRTDGGTQPRAYTDHATVDEYAEAMQGGAEFPPVIVFSDGAAFWLADGFHRMLAAHKLGRESMRADIRKGTVRDAILFSVGANAAHGRPRTRADRRHAVSTLLRDDEWSGWSDQVIADRCAVDVRIVYELRGELSGSNAPDRPRRVARTRNGKTTEFVMKTANIGGNGRKSRAARAAEPPAPDPAPIPKEAAPTVARVAAVTAKPPTSMANPAQAIAETVWSSLCSLPRDALVEIHRRLGRLLEMRA